MVYASGSHLRIKLIGSRPISAVSMVSLSPSRRMLLFYLSTLKLLVIGNTPPSESSPTQPAAQLGRYAALVKALWKSKM
jgi:hypothetical protein